MKEIKLDLKNNNKNKDCKILDYKINIYDFKNNWKIKDNFKENKGKIKSRKLCLLFLIQWFKIKNSKLNLRMRK
jgi:hypothetical protein